MACSAFVSVGGGGVGFGFRWCWLSARMAGMLPSRKRVRRRRMALRKDSLAFGKARTRLSKVRAARHRWAESSLAEVKAQMELRMAR